MHPVRQQHVDPRARGVDPQRGAGEAHACPTASSGRTPPPSRSPWRTGSRPCASPLPPRPGEASERGRKHPALTDVDRVSRERSRRRPPPCRTIRRDPRCRLIPKRCRRVPAPNQLAAKRVAHGGRPRELRVRRRCRARWPRRRQNAPVRPAKPHRARPSGRAMRSANRSSSVAPRSLDGEAEEDVAGIGIERLCRSAPTRTQRSRRRTPRGRAGDVQRRPCRKAGAVCCHLAERGAA